MSEMDKPNGMAEARYQPARGAFWWHVVIGDGQQTVGKCHSKNQAEHLASALRAAFLDGAFVVAAENDRLRAEVEWLRKHANAQAVAASLAFDETAQLRAEVEALRADAGRYRWLRRDITSLSDIKRMQDIVTNLCEDHMDAAIDAAKEARNG